MLNNRKFRSSRPEAIVLLGLVGVVCCVVLAGCGSDTVPMNTVTGTISFNGAPVEEGLVTFEDPETGYAASGELGPGGGYTLEVPDGNYQVGIEPPTVAVEATADTPADEDYKKVDNIPEKYWYGHGSGLAAQVSGSETKFDFDMQP